MTQWCNTLLPRTLNL